MYRDPAREGLAARGISPGEPRRVMRNATLHRHVGSLIAVCALGPILTGCATTQSPSGDDVEIRQVARQWQDALAEERFGRALSLVSKDFAGPAWPDKDALEDYLDTARKRGFFAHANIRDEPHEVSIRAGTARVYPVGIHADLGLAIFALTLEKESSNWKITSIEMELY